MCHAPVLGVSTDQVYLLTLHLQSSLGRVHGERAWGKPSTFHTSVNYCCEIARCLLTHFGCEEAMPPKRNGSRALISSVYVLITVCGNEAKITVLMNGYHSQSSITYL